ncbi:MAG: carboxypeptidase-like regulatory domain-containing protein, partial [Gemmatimonadales bacterium]
MLTRRLTFGLATVASLVATLGTSTLFAQGTTNGAIAATVTDAAGHPRPNARVVAVHEPSGSRYEGRTRDDGRLTIPNMRVGGPYKVTVASIGLQSQVQDGISVNLGQTTDLSFVLRDAAVQIGEVTITGETDKIFSSARTGAATTISREVLGSLPTISGRLEHVARLTPQSGGGMSFV